MTTKQMIAVVALGAAVLSACGSSSKTNTSAGGTSESSAGGSAEPGASLAVADVSGVGKVLVDGRGRTVYVLTADGKTNLPCDNASGCTQAWPDVSLPDGVTAAKAGNGVDSSLLGTKKVGDETYPTYNGWLLYEFSGDSAAGQAHGQGIKSFGGTWSALDAKGALLSATGGSTSSTAASSGGYRY